MNMKMKKEDAWNKFYKTGSVADYLSYLITQDNATLNTVTSDANGLSIKGGTDADKIKGLGVEPPKYW